MSIGGPAVIGCTEPPARLWRLLARERQPRLGKAVLEQADAVVAPERLALEDEDGHAEDLVGRGFFLRRLVVAHAVAGEIVAIGLLGQPHRRDHAGHGVRLVHLQLAAEELVEHDAAVLDEPPVLLGEQAADQRRCGVVDLERALDDEAAGRRFAQRRASR